VRNSYGLKKVKYICPDAHHKGIRGGEVSSTHLNVGFRWMSVVRFTCQQLYTLGMSPSTD